MNRKRGRPRNENSRRAILEATLGLVEENGSGKGLTIEGVAKRAGVGKQTIYKWWDGIGDIFLEILREIASREIDEPAESQDLGTFLAYTFESLKPSVRLILRALMAEAILDDKIREKLIAQLIWQRRQSLMRILARSEGLLMDNPTLLTDLIFGLMWYRLLLHFGPLDAAEGHNIAAAFQGQMQ